MFLTLMCDRKIDMRYYIDVAIKPDAEMRLNALLNSIYTKIHKALFDLGSTTIGVSFPRYKVMLGNVLRIHGEETNLSDLENLDWVGGMKGYCQVSSIIPVPEVSKFRTVSRKQTTMSQAKLRRIIKRESISKEDTKRYKEKMFSKGLNEPYLELVSISNRRKYRRYIEFGELLDQPVYGKFDQFGLSKTATVPWF